MIIHKYRDGSVGYEYEVGDSVIVERTIHGGWFDVGPRLSEWCVVYSIEKGHWRIVNFEIKFSEDWGTVTCSPWGVVPTKDTIRLATTIDVVEA